VWNRLADFFERLWNHLYEAYSTRLDAKHWSLVLQTLVDSLLVVLLAALVLLLIRRSLHKIQTRVDALQNAIYRRKIETIGSLALSTAKYAIYIAALLWILTLWGVPKESLIAGSAVIGAAIGFGSQGLVQDLITGLSMLAEEQLALGDFVEINGKSGAVEEIGLRVVKLRDQLGAQHVIFNRTIGMVSNFTSGAVPAVVDVSLESTDAGPKAREVAARVCTDLSRELPYFTAVPIVEGVVKSSTNDVYLRIRLNVLPQQQDIIQNLFVDRIKRAFAAEKIVIPGDRVRVVILSDLFRKAIERIKPSALPASSERLFEGSV
jgi:small-conductance mechanosensitive channel